MKPKKQSIREEIHNYWYCYILQSLAAGVVLFLIFVMLRAQHEVISASVGATAFIVFVRPNDETASVRSIVGGHLVGFFVGAAFAFIPHAGIVSAGAVYALAVSVAICTMGITDTEHAPAAGTALGTAMSGFEPGVLLCLMLAAGSLSVIRHYGKDFLHELV